MKSRLPGWGALISSIPLLGLLQHWQAICRFAHLVALRNGFQNTRFLFFGEIIKRLGLAGFVVVTLACKK